MEHIFINGNVPSSKNSRVFNMKMKRSFASKATQKFVKTSKQDFLDNKEAFLELIKDIDKPYNIGMHFVRDTKRKYDYHNMVQIVFDLMVAHGWIDDDNITEVYPIPFKMNGVKHTIDKHNPGVFITVFKEEDLP